MGTPLRLCVLTHRDADVVTDVDVEQVLESARGLGLQPVAPVAEVGKHPALAACAAPAGEDWREVARASDMVLVLAGDGTLLRVLGALPGGPPALGINYGMLGYLSSIGHGQIDHALRAVASGEYDIVELPALRGRIERADGSTSDIELPAALNDIVASGGVTGRIGEVAWRLHGHRADGEEIVEGMGIVPCDGMVVSTPVGSTAYNLSNGGPVIAWGVGGYVVSFIAPHTLAARPLVVAPGDSVELEHMGRGVDLQLLVDGAPVAVLGPGDRLHVWLDQDAPSRLAVVDDTTFYARYRDSFAAASGDADVRRPRALPAPPLASRREGDS